MKPKIAALFRYPVKGLSPEPIEAIEVSEDYGFPGDRSFAVALPTNDYDESRPTAKRKSEFLMLARYPRLAAIKASFSSDDRILTLEFDDQRVAASVDSPEGRREISRFLQPFFEGSSSEGANLRFVAGNNEHRFTDVGPHSRRMMHSISLVNLNSVRELEHAMGVTLDLRRFRANIVIDGLPAWSEQDMYERDFLIGDVRFRGMWPTSRCPATQVDPDTGVRDENIPKFLKSEYGHQNLGIYISALSSGRLAVNDAINFRPDEAFIPHIKYLENSTAGVTSKNPEQQLAQKLQNELQVSEGYAKSIAAKPLAFEFFIAGSRDLKDKEIFAKWMVNELFGRLNQSGLSIDESPVTADSFGLLCRSLEIGEIRPKDLKDLLDSAWAGPVNFQTEISKLANEEKLDSSAVRAECERVVSNNPENVSKFRSGNGNLLGWFVGQVMKATSGAADPETVRSEMEKLLIEEC